MLAKIDNLLDLFEKVVITTGMATATLLLFTNVVLRYMFDSGLTWALEAVQYIFAWVVLVGAAHGVKTGIHLGIDILVEKFSVAAQRRFSLFSLFLCLIFVGCAFVLSVQYIMRIYAWGDLSLDLQIPQWIPYLAIPTGLGLMFYHFVKVGWNIWKGNTISIHATEATRALEELEQ